VDVIALLSPTLIARARSGLATRHTIHPARTVSEIASALRVGAADLVMIDPRSADVETLSCAIAAWGDIRPVPIVLYTTLCPDAMRPVARLVHAGALRLVLAGYDDGPGRLAATLDALPASAFSARFLKRLRAPLSALPGSLRLAITRLFNEPREFLSPDDLAAACRMNRRTLQRWTGRVGLSPPAAVLTCARLVRACFLLRSSRWRLADVSRHAGFGSPRILRVRLLAMTGFLPSTVENAESSEPVLRLLEGGMRVR